MNSTLIGLNKEDVRQFKKHGLGGILVSLLGPSSEIHDPITQLKGSFDKTVQGIEFALKHRLPLGTANMVVSKKNLPYVFETASFIKSLGISSFAATRASCPTNCTNFSDLELSKEEFRTYQRALLRVKEELEMPCAFLEGYPLCGLTEILHDSDFIGRKCLAGVTGLTIGADGSLRPCAHMSENYGNIFSTGIQNAWQKMRPWVDIQYMPKPCLSCSLVKSCGGGCRMDAKMSTGSMTGLDPHASTEDIDKAIKKFTIATQHDHSKIPPYFIVNPQMRTRTEFFGGIAFVNPKFSVMLDDNGMELIAKLEPGRRYAPKDLPDLDGALLKQLCKNKIFIESKTSY